ncbi:sigma-70 family RNA polymerase sigma factor [Actinoallomurus vinaceus]|uniref:Sigma-70 family RNA polymerase sigma factor n=1 Tax=Actinoallomurus vinaceus TaxID=1080074 RepID=A0ABP8U864_9ACTN
MNRWIPGRRERPGPDAETPPEPRTPLRLVEGETYTGWEAIYLDNVHRIYRLMFSKVGNRPDAEDLTAEVFLSALRPLRTSASVGEVRAYLLATARSVLAAHWRRTLGQEITAIDIERVAADFGRPPEAGRSAERVAGILAALPDRYRRVLELRFLRSYTIREAARELGVSVGNAKVLQHRALRLAAEVVREDHSDDRMGR